MTKDRVIGWMSQHGYTGYADQIEILECARDELIGDAGRYWQHCEFTQAKLAKIEAQIAEIKRDALDRYEDWATR